jgi:DNA-binding beta-propeller fold protein YncE
MTLAPAAPPQPVPVISGFDYVTVDAARHRVFAAHTGSQALLIVNADTGRVIGQVRVGPVHGVAVNPESGNVYTGDGTARTVSEIDPVSQKVLKSADVDGTVDAIAYDPGLHRIYADEDDGTRIFVVDAATMKQVATIAIPGHKPEYLAIDPASHTLYQNIDDLAEIAVIDPNSLKVTRTIPTPALTHNHPLQFDAAYHVLVAGGKNGVLASYTPEGRLINTTAISPAVDQCDLNPAAHQIACAGDGQIDVIQLRSDGSLQHIARGMVAKSAHTLAFDSRTQRLWVVWAAATGDVIQEFSLKP